MGAQKLVAILRDDVTPMLRILNQAECEEENAYLLQKTLDICTEIRNILEKEELQFQIQTGLVNRIENRLWRMAAAEVNQIIKSIEREGIEESLELLPRIELVQKCFDHNTKYVTTPTEEQFSLVFSLSSVKNKIIAALAQESNKGGTTDEPLNSDNPSEEHLPDNVIMGNFS